MTVDEWEQDPEAQDVALRAALEFQAAAEEDGSATERILAGMEATRLQALAAKPKPKPPRGRMG